MFILRKVNHHVVLNEINMKYLFMILKYFFPVETFSQFMVCNATKLIILVNNIFFRNQGEVQKKKGINVCIFGKHKKYPGIGIQYVNHVNQVNYHKRETYILLVKCL